MFFLANSRFKIIFILILVATISGLFWSWGDFGSALPTPESGDASFYNRLAVDILEGRSRQSYQQEVTRAPIGPAYPYFLAGIYLIFGKSYDAVIFVQLLFYCLTILLVYFIAKEVVEEKLALGTAVLTVFCYQLAEWAGVLNRTMLFIFFVILLIYCLYRALNVMRMHWFVFAAVAYWLALLTNEIVRFFPLFVVLGFLIAFGKSLFVRRVFAKVAVFFVLTIILPVIFLTYGNVQQDSFNSIGSVFIARKAQLIREASGQYLDHFVGLTLGYYFTERVNPDVKYKLFLDDIKAANEFAVMRERGYDYNQIAPKMFNDNIYFLLRNPHKIIAVSFLDFLQFNGPMIFNPATLNIGAMQNLFIKGTHPEIPPAGKVAILIILRLFYWTFFGFVIYGMAKAVREWRKFIWILLIILYFNLVYSAVYGLARYAIPIYPFYILLFVVGVSEFWRKHNAKRTRLSATVTMPVT